MYTNVWVYLYLAVEFSIDEVRTIVRGGEQCREQASRHPETRTAGEDGRHRGCYLTSEAWRDVSPPMTRAPGAPLYFYNVVCMCLCPVLCFSPKAEEDNPDPSKLAPVAVIGWENLKERLVGQQKEMQKMAEFVAVSTSYYCCTGKSTP